MFNDCCCVHLPRHAVITGTSLLKHPGLLAPLARVNDWLITAPTIGSPLYRGHRSTTLRLVAHASFMRLYVNGLLFILYQREDVGVAVFKACPVCHPIRCCSHNRPPMGSSVQGMSKSEIGIKTEQGRQIGSFTSMSGCWQSWRG